MKHSGTISFLGNLLCTREIGVFLMACAIDCINEKFLSYFDAHSAFNLGISVYLQCIYCMRSVPPLTTLALFYGSILCHQFSLPQCKTCLVIITA